MTGLGNADDVYKHYLKVIEENKRLEKKLEIAVKALEFYADNRTWNCCYRNQCAYVDGFEAAQALAKIKEIK